MNGIFNPEVAFLSYRKNNDDNVNNDAVVGDDSELVDIPLAPDSMYICIVNLLFDSTATADFKFNINTSQNVNARGWINYDNAAFASTLGVIQIRNAAALTADIVCGAFGAGTINMATIFLVIKTTLACTLKVLFAQGTAEVSDTKLKAGSNVVLSEIK